MLKNTTGKKRGAKIKSAPSHFEEQMAMQINMVGLPTPEREHRWHPVRRWRFDFAWPMQRVALEVEGGTWASGRHSRGTGFEADCHKYNAAMLEGWRVFRVTGDMVAAGTALATIEKALMGEF